MKKFLICVVFFVSVNASAQQIIEFVITAAAGGPNDLVTRAVDEEIKKHTGLRTVLVHKPGAGHTIGRNYVQRSSNPILVLSASDIQNHSVYNELNEIFTLGDFTNLLLVSKASGLKSLDQLIALSKQRDIKFGHGGPGTFSYYAMETLCSAVIPCLGVPYKGGAEGILALMTQDIDVYAIVSYGSEAFLQNTRIAAIHEIKMPDRKGWVRLFSKNVSEKDRYLIRAILEKQSAKFYKNLGFAK
jgi:tripartite-type tricarboxylate transporter receptor subunit TctC